MKKLLPLLLLPFFVDAQHQKDIRELDDFIQKGMADWQVPGLSVAVVKDGKKLFTKGYGITDVESNSPVTTSTRFMIGSTTKAMTAFALATLVDEGKLNWNDKVVQHYPEFQLNDVYATRDVTIVDLLTHRAGLGNADFLWSFNDIESEEIIRRLRLVEPAYPLRGGYTYQNIMYLAAGMVIEKVSNKPWEDYIREKIFTPLEMRNSRALYAQLESEDDYVKPHYLIENKVEVIPFLAADKIGPAGSIWSTADEMANWMLMLLDSGKFKGKKILEKERIAELWDTYTIIPPDQFYPTTKITKPNWTTYGLGWFQHDYKGYQLQFHTGSLPGLTAIIGIIPELNFGVYAFGNLDHAELRHAIMYKAIDLFHDLGTTDWNEEFLKLYGEIKKQNDQKSQEMLSSQIKDTQPSLGLEQYTGTYESELFGTIQIKRQNQQLLAVFRPGFEATLSHWHFDTFFANWSMAYSSPDLFSFDLNASGEIESVSFLNFSYLKVKGGN